MQRESQVTNILTELRGPEAEPETPQPSLDKKLKTSEGRAEGVQSPPLSPKDSSDSGSDSSSADSIILGIKARQKAEAEKPSSPASQPGGGEEAADRGGAGGRPRDRDDQSVDQQLLPSPARHPASSAGEQLKHPGAADRDRDSTQKKSIFSPDRSPRTTADKSRGGEGSLSGREHDPARGPESWKSPRDWKFSESASAGREISAATGSATKSPALSGSTARPYEGSRSSPMQQHRSPGFGRSPARHSQHPLNKSLDLNKSSDNLSSLNKSEIKKTEENATADRDSSRKFSVESKDSDVDSAKSSLPDASTKEDSTDTLFFGDKLGDNKQKTEQAPTKKDEGYVSAEKDQNDNAQEAVGKLRDGLGVVTNDKVGQNKNFKRLSTEDPMGSQDQIVAKQNSLLPPGQNVQQQLLDGQPRSRQQHQKLDITNTFDNLTKDDNKNVADAFATQQQHLEALLMNQMFNHQRKSGHESLSQQSMAYMQQYMKVRVEMFHKTSVR